LARAAAAATTATATPAATARLIFRGIAAFLAPGALAFAAWLVAAASRLGLGAAFAVGAAEAVATHGPAETAAILPLLVEQVLVVSRLHVGDVQKTVAAHAKIDECRLDARLDVDDAALVDVADIALGTGPLHVELFQHAVFNDGDAALFGLQDIDQHFLFHAVPLFAGVRGVGTAVPASPSSVNSNV